MGGVFASPVINSAIENPTAKLPASKPPVTKPTTAAVPSAFGLTPRMKLLAGVGFCGSFSKL